MHKIKFFLTLLIVHCTLLIGTASAQWWVQGGNLLWPYGDVTIQNDLNVGMNLTINDTLILIDDSTSIYAYRFYEDGELSENFITLSTHNANYNDVLKFGSLGLSYYRDGIIYSSITTSSLSSVNPVGTFSLTGQGTNGVIQYSRKSDSYRVEILIGAGSPEGVVSARIGSMFLRTDGGAGTTLYIKESGISTTGWVAK